MGAARSGVRLVQARFRARSPQAIGRHQVIYPGGEATIELEFVGDEARITK